MVGSQGGLVQTFILLHLGQDRRTQSFLNLGALVSNYQNKAVSNV